MNEDDCLIPGAGITHGDGAVPGINQPVGKTHDLVPARSLKTPAPGCQHLRAKPGGQSPQFLKGCKKTARIDDHHGDDHHGDCDAAPGAIVSKEFGKGGDHDCRDQRAPDR